MAALDADRIEAMADGPATFELARTLRAEVARETAELETKRAALARAQWSVAWASAYRRTADPPDDYSIESRDSHDEERVLS